MAKNLFMFFNRISRIIKKEIGMQITPISNTLNTTKYKETTNKTQNSNISNPSFTGFWNFLPKKNSLRYVKLDSDTTIFSPKELKQLRENVTKEVKDIIRMPETSALKKRLDDLLTSPFVDYKTDYSGESLADKIVYNFEAGKGTDMYRYFLTKSLAESMPLEILKSKDFKGIVSKRGNEPLKYVLETYHKMNEKTPEAEMVRKMVDRFKNADIPIPNKNYYLAESIINNQLLMSKTYINTFGINPNDNIEIISNKSTHTEVNFRELIKKFNNPPIMENSVTNTKFFIVNPDKAKNSDGSYFNYGNVSEPFTLYKLCGLSKDEGIRNIFDVIPFMKNNLHKYRPRNEKDFAPINKFEHFLVGTKDYHPELTSVDFVEKYVKSFDGDKKEVYAILSDYLPIKHNTVFKTELENKINMLSQSNSTENKKELDLLNKIYNYIK